MTKPEYNLEWCVWTSALRQSLSALWKEVLGWPTPPTDTASYQCSGHSSWEMERWGDGASLSLGTSSGFRSQLSHLSSASISSFSCKMGIRKKPHVITGSWNLKAMQWDRRLALCLAWGNRQKAPSRRGSYPSWAWHLISWTFALENIDGTISYGGCERWRKWGVKGAT